jgi:hypothetical protein
MLASVFACTLMFGIDVFRLKCMFALGGFYFVLLESVILVPKLPFIVILAYSNLLAAVSKV